MTKSSHGSVRIYLREPCPNPACGTVDRLVSHLISGHGFAQKRARSIAARWVAKERLAVAECRQLGIPLQQVKLRGALSHRRIERDEVPEGLPTDAQLDATLRRAGFGVANA